MRFWFIVIVSKYLKLRHILETEQMRLHFAKHFVICCRGVNFNQQTLQCLRHRQTYCTVWISCHIEISFPVGSGVQLTSRQKALLFRNQRISVFIVTRVLGSDARQQSHLSTLSVCFKRKDNSLLRMKQNAPFPVQQLHRKWFKTLRSKALKWSHAPSLE